ncbi:hypothetical protein [Myxococcus xanthus]|uniref:hypothetical protein n=1 Tax=Myxococcus xanthus TaxID=34 RepID=UPI00112E5BCF|nr:hypothetical protein [Myxococcus xanthus]QDF04295.1 hypothetical protein BHS04_13910 [Myxococcus xanthus]
MNILVKTRSGSLALVLLTSASSAGFPYYSLEWHPSGSAEPSRYFIWQSELPWLCRSFAVLAMRLDFSRFRADGLYPLLAQLGPSGGPMWFAQIQGGGANLTLRRYRDIWKDQEGEKNHTRYLIFDSLGKFPLQLRLPAAFVHSEALGDFARQCLAALDQEVQRLEGAFSLPPQLRNERSSEAFFQRVAVRVPVKDDFRRLLAFPGMPVEQVEVSALHEPALVAALRACEQSRTPEEVSAELGQVLDGRALFELLAWTQRYAPEVLRTGYILTPVEQRKIVAVKDLKVYAADPLLSALQPTLPEPVPGPDRPVQPPQCTEQQLLAARKRALSTASLSTAFGQAALPSTEWAQTINHFLRPPTALNIYRWRIFQLMTLAASLACNLPGGLDNEPLLELQRLALLTHDVTHLFAEDGGDDIHKHTEAACHQWRDLLQGRAQPMYLGVLPKRGEKTSAPARRGRR